MRKNKKGSELPINIIVWMILGIVLFGAGLSLFFKFYNGGEKTMDNLQLKIKTDLGSLNCQDQEWICSPDISLNEGEKGTYTIYVENLDKKQRYVSFKIDGATTLDNGLMQKKISNSCGYIRVIYPSNTFTLESMSSEEIPIYIESNHVSKKPCSFSAIMEATYGTFNKKSVLLINVK